MAVKVAGERIPGLSRLFRIRQYVPAFHDRHSTRSNGLLVKNRDSFGM